MTSLKSGNIHIPNDGALVRNLCGTGAKDPRQQSSKHDKWKVHDLSFTKHQTLLKNSSWGRSYDGLKKGQNFHPEIFWRRRRKFLWAKSCCDENFTGNLIISAEIP